RERQERIGSQIRAAESARTTPVTDQELQALKAAAGRLDQLLKEGTDADAQALKNAAARLDQILAGIGAGKDVTGEIRKRGDGSERKGGRQNPHPYAKNAQSTGTRRRNDLTVEIKRRGDRPGDERGEGGGKWVVRIRRCDRGFSPIRRFLHRPESRLCRLKCPHRAAMTTETLENLVFGKCDVSTLPTHKA